MTRLFLIRHGETDWNRSRRFQGQQDILLNAAGLHQAALCAEALRTTAMAAVYSSDLRRAFATAEAIAAGRLPVVPLAALRERYYGQWEGLTRDEIAEQFGAQAAEEHYGVEPIASLEARLYVALEQIAGRHPGDNVAVVSHGGAINAFLHQITDGRIGTGKTVLRNTSVTIVVRHSSGRWEAETVGEASHLDNEERRVSGA